MCKHSNQKRSKMLLKGIDPTTGSRHAAPLTIWATFLWVVFPPGLFINFNFKAQFKQLTTFKQKQAANRIERQQPFFVLRFPFSFFTLLNRSFLSVIFLTSNLISSIKSLILWFILVIFCYFYLLLVYLKLQRLLMEFGDEHLWVFVIYS